MHHQAFLTALLLSSPFAVANPVKPVNSSTPTPPVFSAEVIEPAKLRVIAKGFSTQTPGYPPKAVVSRGRKPHFSYPLEPHHNKVPVVTPTRVVDVSKYPWSTIGRIAISAPELYPQMTICSGAMVGSDLMLTASHCIPWKLNPKTISMRFAPAYKNGAEAFGSSLVSRCMVVTKPFGNNELQRPWGLDYAICQLVEPLGKQTGWLGTQSWNDNKWYHNQQWASGGYPTERAKGYDGEFQITASNITFHDIDVEAGDGKELESANFAAHGWSGGPLWGYSGGVPTIVGVTSGYEQDCKGRESDRECKLTDFTTDLLNVHGVFAGGKFMTDLVVYAKAKWAPF